MTAKEYSILSLAFAAREARSTHNSYMYEEYMARLASALDPQTIIDLLLKLDVEGEE